MKRLVLAGLCLALAGLPGPVRAHTPVPPPRFEYYGPLRICDGAFAFDVRDGEGYIKEGYPDSNPTYLILSNGGYLKLGSPWLYDAEALKPFAHLTGVIELPTQRLQRFEMRTATGEPHSVVYLYSAKAGANSWKYTVESDQFDGSDRDLDILERIAFGDRGRQMCAAMPDGLRPGPERETNDVIWLSPTRHAGPLTICAAGLAFDVRPGEAALLPWPRFSAFFRIVAGDSRIDIAGLDERVWRRGGEPDVQGPVASDPRFVTGKVVHLPILSPIGTLSHRADAQVFILWRSADAKPSLPHGQSHVGFTFDGAISEAEGRAFIQRLRTRRPEDKCLSAEPA